MTTSWRHRLCVWSWRPALASPPPEPMGRDPLTHEKTWPSPELPKAGPPGCIAGGRTQLSPGPGGSGCVAVRAYALKPDRAKPWPLRLPAAWLRHHLASLHIIFLIYKMGQWQPASWCCDGNWGVESDTAANKLCQSSDRANGPNGAQLTRCHHSRLPHERLQPLRAHSVLPRSREPPETSGWSIQAMSVRHYIQYHPVTAQGGGPGVLPGFLPLPGRAAAKLGWFTDPGLWRGTQGLPVSLTGQPHPHLLHTSGFCVQVHSSVLEKPLCEVNQISVDS